MITRRYDIERLEPRRLLTHTINGTDNADVIDAFFNGD
jgi:hypothetical protein